MKDMIIGNLAERIRDTLPTATKARGRLEDALEACADLRNNYSTFKVLHLDYCLRTAAAKGTVVPGYTALIEKIMKGEE